MKEESGTWTQGSLASREIINSLKAVNNTSKNKGLGIADDLCKWSKPKNSNSRSRHVRTEDVPQVKPSNRFIVLEIDPQSTGLFEAYGKQSKTTCWDGKIQKKKILLLGSSHEREIGPMFLEHVGTQHDITSIFEPNEPFANVVEDLRKLGNDFTKRDHIIIVGGHATSHITRLHIRIQSMLHLTLPGYILGSSPCYISHYQATY